MCSNTAIEISGPPSPLLLYLKSTFEYSSLAHFIDIVLVVQIIFMDDIWNVVVPVFGEDEELRGFHEQEEEDKWLIQNEFVENFSFKISSSPPAHRICGSNLFISCVTSAYRGFNYVYIEIRNNTSGLSMLRRAFVSSKIYKREIQSLLHMKLGGNDPSFDNGDDVSISVRPQGPAIQIRTVGVQWLHEEEGNDIQSKEEVARVEIASRFFRNYYCPLHGKHSPRNVDWWYFAKKGHEI